MDFRFPQPSDGRWEEVPSVVKDAIAATFAQLQDFGTTVDELSTDLKRAQSEAAAYKLLDAGKMMKSVKADLLSLDEWKLRAESQMAGLRKSIDSQGAKNADVNIGLIEFLKQDSSAINLSTIDTLVATVTGPVSQFQTRVDLLDKALGKTSSACQRIALDVDNLRSQVQNLIAVREKQHLSTQQTLKEASALGSQDRASIRHLATATMNRMDSLCARMDSLSAMRDTDSQRVNEAVKRIDTVDALIKGNQTGVAPLPCDIEGRIDAAEERLAKMEEALSRLAFRPPDSQIAALEARIRVAEDAVLDAVSRLQKQESRPQEAANVKEKRPKRKGSRSSRPKPKKGGEAIRGLVGAGVTPVEREKGPKLGEALLPRDLDSLVGLPSLEEQQQPMAFSGDYGPGGSAPDGVAEPGSDQSSVLSADASASRGEEAGLVGQGLAALGIDMQQPELSPGQKSDDPEELRVNDSGLVAGYMRSIEQSRQRSTTQLTLPKQRLARRFNKAGSTAALQPLQSSLPMQNTGYVPRPSTAAASSRLRARPAAAVSRRSAKNDSAESFLIRGHAESRRGR